MKTQPISLLSGLIAAIALPITLHAASLFWNPTKIARDNGIVVLAEESAKPASKTRMDVDSNGVILKGYDPVAYFNRHQAVKGNPAIQTKFGGAIYYFVSATDAAREFRSNIDENKRKADENWIPLSRAEGQPFSRGPR